MKITTLAAIIGAVLLSGCEGRLPDDVRSALAPREAHRSQVFQADQKATYDAARAALRAMDFRFVRGGPAEGEIEALSAISRGDNSGSSRQISMKVHLSPAAEPGTEVEVSLTEILEEDSANVPGIATQTPLSDTPLYQDFFRNIQDELNAPSKP